MLMVTRRWATERHLPYGITQTPAARQVKFVPSFVPIGVGSLCCPKGSGHNVGPSAIPRKFPASTRSWHE